MSHSYHQNYSRISKTMLGVFLRSPSDYDRFYVSQTDEPPGPKKQMVIGSAVHAILLEKCDPTDVIAVYPADCLTKAGSLNGKAAAQFREENDGKYCMKQADFMQVLRAVGAALKHELGALLRTPGAVFELPQEFTCPHSGLDCRLMADFFLDMGDHVLAYDLKTTADIYPAGIARTSRMFKYWLQDAHYSSGLSVLTGKPVRFRFWFLEVDHPNRIAPYEYNERSREIAFGQYRNDMVRLAQCYETGNWRDDWAGKVNDLNLSPWDVDEATLAAETELEGFDEDETDEQI